MKHGDSPVTKESTKNAANAKDDTITASDSAEMTTTIDNCWVTETGGKTAPSKESW
jgi:hypothetical protein